MAEATRLKKCGTEAIFNGIICLTNVMKIHRSVQNLLVGDRQKRVGDLISLLSFLENRLKLKKKQQSLSLNST
jgi:hypothetical protein